MYILIKSRQFYTNSTIYFMLIDQSLLCNKPQHTQIDPRYPLLSFNLPLIPHHRMLISPITIIHHHHLPMHSEDATLHQLLHHERRPRNTLRHLFPSNMPHKSRVFISHRTFQRNLLDVFSLLFLDILSFISPDRVISQEEGIS